MKEIPIEVWVGCVLVVLVALGIRFLVKKPSGGGRVGGLPFMLILAGCGAAWYFGKVPVPAVILVGFLLFIASMRGWKKVLPEKAK